MLIRDLDFHLSDTGRGRPFIWGHGLTWSQALENEADLFLWGALADVLQIVRYDARGHGATGASYRACDYTWPQLGADMLAVAAAAVNAPRFIAGGASMGCATALYAALAAPERIDALVLAIPPTAWETRSAQAAVYENMAGLVERKGLPALVELFRQRPLFPEFLLQALPALREIGPRYLAKLDERMLPFLLRGAGASNLPPRATLAMLNKPTLILAWGGDNVHPLSTAHELQHLLPSAKLHIAETLPQVRAWPQVLREFIEQLP
jgi:pimeloyl-ACP methyl ester carboxylesterase